MIKRSLLVVVVSIMALSASAQSAQRSEYYAVLPFWESPYQPFKGAFPIDKNTADKRVHVQFDYNAQNQIVTSHVRVGKHYKDFEGFFGNLNINAPITKVKYEAQREIHYFYDRLGNPTTVMGSVMSKIYLKDEYNRNISLTFLDSEGKSSIDMFGNASYEWTHLADGSIIEERRNSSGELTPLRGQFQFLRTKMLFGPDGYFTTLINVDEDNNPVNAECGAAQLRYYYDSQGRFDRWEVFDAVGNKATGPSQTAGEENTFYEYDLKDIVFFDTVGNPAIHWSGAERWHFAVDKFGNRTKLSFQKNNKEPMEGNNGFAYMVFDWSKDGRFLLSQSYLNTKKQPVMHSGQGFHRVSYTRDRNGLITEKQYFDSLNNPCEQTGTGISRTVYEYSSKGLLTKTTNYNLNNQPIN